MRNRYYQGPLTDHFNGVRFFHPGLASSDKNFLDVLKWKILGKRVSWPKIVPARAGVRPADRISGLKVTHIGHASYLVQAGGYNILVDPVWAARASPVGWAGPRRHTPPPLPWTTCPQSMPCWCPITTTTTLMRPLFSGFGRSTGPEYSPLSETMPLSPGTPPKSRYKPATGGLRFRCSQPRFD